MYRVEVKKILNTDKFRPAAVHFTKYGYYTTAPKGTTAFYDYWDEETKRCLNGYDTGDGDRISGYFYFYLNYCPIYRLINNATTGKSERIKDFPVFYDYDKAYFDALEEAERVGKHLVVIKKRGAGYSFKGGSMLCRNFYLIPGSKSYAIASEQEFLIKDGLLTKAWEIMDFVDEHTAWYKKRQKVDKSTHKRASAVVDKEGVKVEIGYKSEIIGVTLKNDINKAVGKRGKLILWEEGGKFSGLKTAWLKARPSVEDTDHKAFGLMVAYGCVCAGTKVWNNSGNLVNIEALKQAEGIIGYNTFCSERQKIEAFREPYETNCYKIITNSGRELNCSHDHPILYSTQHMSKDVPGMRSGKKRVKMKSWGWKKAEEIKEGYQVGVSEEVPFFGVDSMWNPRLIGWLIGDGTYGYDKTPRLANCDNEIIEYIEKNFNTSIEKSYTTKEGKLYKETRIKDICSRLRELGIYGQVKNEKRIPQLIYKCTKEDVCEFLGGLFDTDGYIKDLKSKKSPPRINITSSCKEMLIEILHLLQKLGIHGKINTIKASNRTRVYKGKTIKDSNNYYRLNIGDVKSLYTFASVIKLYPKHKQERLDKYKFILDEYNSEISKYIHGIRFERVKSVESIGIQTVYNLTASGNHNYIANGIITHNTGGSSDADYEGLKDLFYEPDAYNCLPIENIWDDGANEPCGFFVPQYYNMGQFMDKDGNSDVKAAIKFEILEREKIIKNATDRTTIDRYVSEQPFTPMEATLQISSNIFPKAELIKHLSFIKTNKSVQSFKQVGKLIVDENGLLKWQQSEKPRDLTKYRVEATTDPTGEIVIWEHPVDNPPLGLYIAATDSYDHDQSGSGSLGSTFIYKRFQRFESYYDILVAEYTGRPEKAEMYYENVKKLLQYYNAKLLYENQNPGISTYFRNNRVDYLLADQPDIIDKIIKNSIVNRAKGIHMTKEIDLFAEGLIKDWLITERADGKLNLHTILSEPLLEELIAYNDKGNFDRVSALKILMLYKEELHNIKIGEKRDESRRIQLFEGGIYRDYTDTYLQQII